MLSKQERLFISDPQSFSYNVTRLHRCRINKKVKLIAADIEAIISSNKETGIDVTPLLNLMSTKINIEIEEEKVFQNSETKMSDRLKNISNW